ncbi:MAG TPA: hypothetical protein VF273_09475, partial [Pelobium sp.]
GALRVVVCSWRFLLVLALVVLLFLLPFVVVARVLGGRWRWLLVWVVLCWSFRLLAFPPLGLALLLLAFAVWVLLPAVACCGVLFLLVVSFLYFDKLNTSVLAVIRLIFIYSFWRLKSLFGWFKGHF